MLIVFIKLDPSQIELFHFTTTFNCRFLKLGQKFCSSVHFFIRVCINIKKLQPEAISFSFFKPSLTKHFTILLKREL